MKQAFNILHIYCHKFRLLSIFLFIYRGTACHALIKFSTLPNSPSPSLALHFARFNFSPSPYEIFPHLMKFSAAQSWPAPAQIQVGEPFDY